MKQLHVLILLVCALGWTSMSAQLSIPLSYETDVLAEGHELYEKAVYGYAKERYDAYLAIPSDDRTPNWQSNASEAALYSGLCALWMDQDQAQHDLVKLIHEYSPDPVAYEAALEVGNSYYNKKRYRDAIKYYELIDLNQLPNEMKSEVAFKRGYCHFVRKQFDLAENYLTQASAFRTVYYYPSNYYLGMSSFFDEDYPTAANYFEKVSSSKKYKNFIPYYLTQIYFNEQDYQRVVDYGERQLTNPELKKAIEIKGLIGRSYFELGNENKSLTYLREVEAAEVELTTADFYQLGYLAYKEGSYDEAIKNLSKVAEQKDDTGNQANYYLGHAYIQSNKREAARNSFAHVKRKTSNPSLKDEATYNYGLLSAELQHDREAVNALMEIAPTSEYYTVAQEALAKLFLRTEDYDNALRILDDLDKRNPILKEAYQKVSFYKGKQLLDADNLKGAITLFDQSLQYPVDANIHAQTQFTRGLAMHKLGRYGESTTSLNSYNTLRTNQNDDMAYMAPYILGYNYLKQKKYSNAKSHFDTSIKLIDNNRSQISSTYIKQNILSDALVRQGDCSFHSNNYAQAQTSYNRAFEMKKSEFIYAYFQSAIIYGLNGDPIQKIVILEDIHEKYPKSALADDALVEASRTYLNLGKYDEAAKPLQTLTKQYKQSELNTQAYLTLGLISYNKGATQQAIQFYKKVFKHNPTAEERQDAYSALQEIYVQDLKDPDEYLAFVQTQSGGSVDQVLRDSLNYKSAYASYVNAEYDEAQVNLSKYITNFPDGIYRIEAHYFRGECAALSKDYSNAYRDYVYVVDQGSSQYYTKSMRKAALIAYNEIQNYDKAYTYFSTLSELNLSAEQQIEAMLGAMRSAYRLNDFDAALRFAQDVQAHPAATDQDKFSTDYYLANVLYANKSYDDALPPLNRLSKNGTDAFAAEARYLIATIYSNKKELDIAEEMARLAIKENSKYPYWVAKSIILLSDILVATDDSFNAKAALEAVIENFTEDPEIVAEARKKLNAINAGNNTGDENSENTGLLEMEEN